MNIVVLYKLQNLLDFIFSKAAGINATNHQQLFDDRISYQMRVVHQLKTIVSYPQIWQWSQIDC